jgi:hypothetical protein
VGSPSRGVLAAGIAVESDFSDKDPDQPEATGKDGQDEIEDKVPEAVLFHCIAFR